ncbi:3-dehydroquinate synthase [Ectobacillus sp. sgz5001026]|uniref:3-dehydroquinate synthase n=1 Tax=Ectobacillus sp. sgz5001026 TaxID=3242473 RepID=UPI0036D31A5C
MERVHIATKKQYPVLLGEQILDELDPIIHDMEPSVSSILIVTDDNVAPLYLEQVKQAIIGKVYSYVVPNGETAKSFENYYNILTFALENHLDRHSIIIALGGGVIGDLAGFVAASFMRGIRFIQIPTTLLAHDSAVGGKVAVNHPLGKNMIGAFHQPEIVLYNLTFLRSLPENEWRSGFAEVIKHALIWDPAFFEWLRKEVPTISALRGDKLQYALKIAIGVKAAVVSQDEKEKGIRAFLNFGHTLGHAIESILGYGVMTHGDAIAIGMRYAILLSERIYQTDLNYSELDGLFASYGYPTMPKHLQVEPLVEKMKLDKKSNGGIIRMVLLREIGTVEVVSVNDDVVINVLQEFIERESSK